MNSSLSRVLLFVVALLAIGLRAADPTREEMQNALSEARAQLDELKQRYTDTHPRVIEQKAKISALEKQAAGGGWKMEARGEDSKTPRQLIQLDFAGGTVRDFLTTVSKEPRVSFSIIAEDGNALNTPLPPFSLRNADAPTILQVLVRLLQPRGYDLFAVQMEPNSVAAVLTARPGPKIPLPHSAPTLFDSFPVGAFLSEQSIDDIVGAIREGWELDPAHDKDALRLKFHPGTAILLVSGPPEAIQVASKVISQLKGAYDKDSKSNLRKLSPTPDAKR